MQDRKSWRQSSWQWQRGSRSNTSFGGFLSPIGCPPRWPGPPPWRRASSLDPPWPSLDRYCWWSRPKIWSDRCYWYVEIWLWRSHELVVIVGQNLSDLMMWLMTVMSMMTVTSMMTAVAMMLNEKSKTTMQRHRRRKQTCHLTFGTEGEFRQCASLGEVHEQQKYRHGLTGKKIS